MWYSAWREWEEMERSCPTWLFCLDGNEQGSEGGRVVVWDMYTIPQGLSFCVLCCLASAGCLLEFQSIPCSLNQCTITTPQINAPSLPTPRYGIWESPDLVGVLLQRGWARLRKHTKPLAGIEGYWTKLETRPDLPSVLSPPGSQLLPLPPPPCPIFVLEKSSS